MLLTKAKEFQRTKPIVLAEKLKNTSLVLRRCIETEMPKGATALSQYAIAASARAKSYFSSHLTELQLPYSSEYLIIAIQSTLQARSIHFVKQGQCKHL